MVLEDEEVARSGLDGDGGHEEDKEGRCASKIAKEKASLVLGKTFLLLSVVERQKLKGLKDDGDARAGRVERS